ncbi:nicotinamide riboside transporter PnuC [uncultured Ferrimonas sp.]|uniref:nicotinamide riboside transporter PnuC n=1 Tax=uncultured Ferrimonas sp. TaxID=432640 RepID=UPI0026086F2C|nr:nicotinamide riboside transporter PnuC [uncultured Ferrimonas sp.]
MTGWEAVAVVLAIAYLLLAMRQNLWCWAAAAASTMIYTLLFWHVSLLMESALNVFYLVMAAVGFYQWRYGGGNGSGTPLVSWSSQRHAMTIGATAVIGLLLGYIMDRNTSADFAYLDAQTTCFAVLATWMLAKKVVENWLYWVVIDAVSIYLYLNKGLALTAALFVVYVVLAAMAYRQWEQQLHGQIDGQSA